MIRQGGSYVVEKDGSLRQVAEPTQDHPRRNAPRDADGRPLDRPDEPFAETAAPEGVATAEPTKRQTRRPAPAAPAEPAKE